VSQNEELEAVLRRAHTGDAAARDDLLALIRTRARRYAEFVLNGQLGSRVDASDLAQEVCLSISSSFDPSKFPDAPRLLGWLNVVVRNFAKQIREQHFAAKRDARLEIAGAKRHLELSSESTGPATRVARKEIAERVAVMVDQLPVQQRNAVRFMCFEGLSAASAAVKMGVSGEYARVLLYRALQRLKRRLGEQK
jgi:RNA polymerase sigma factor (sigma-70 family)